jgi:predicted Fe-S protein YdhL (DUF1289 family)
LSGVFGRVASPCIGVCRLDDASRLCVGCLRSLDEIAEWERADDARRQEILAAVRSRWAETPPAVAVPKPRP